MLALLLLTPPLAFESLEAIQADELRGERITVRLKIGVPGFWWGARTVIGAGERPDGIERTVILKGKRLDLEPGDSITVTGTLRIILHPRSIVNGVFIPAWTEFRLEE